jgi:GTP pyrophosphokinase
MHDPERTLGSITLAPYIFKAMALIGVRRKAGGNMFRHQLATMTILLDYMIIDPILLKASVIHDLFEDAEGKPGVSRAEIERIDQDGPAVYALVMEVTRRVVDGIREPKPEYLRRIMESSSNRARTLKLADRISNLYALGFVHEEEFVRKFLQETKEHILPFAESINSHMHREMSDLIADREGKLELRLRPVENPSRP